MSGFETVDTGTTIAEAADATIAQLPNESNQAAFFRTVKRLGKESALGRDALPQLVAAIAEAVETGGLDPMEKFDGPDKKKISAAKYVFKVYTDQEDAKSVHNRSKGSTNAQASKIKQIIDACAKPNVYFREALSRAVEMRKGLFIQEGDKKKIKPAFDAYVDMARRQLKKDSSLSDEEVDLDNRKEPKVTDTTVVKELKRAFGILEKLMSGENKSGIVLAADAGEFEPVEIAFYQLRDAIRMTEPDFNTSKAPAEETPDENGEEPEEPTLEPAEAEEPAIQPEVQTSALAAE